MGGGFDVSKLPDEELAALWVRTMDELRTRELVRSANNPVADFAERIVKDKLGLTLAPKSTRSFDATDAEGRRYEIKSRRPTAQTNSRQLSPFRNLEAAGFDYLVAVIFNSDLTVAEMWQAPHAAVLDHASYRQHVNGHILHVKGAFLADHRVVRLT